MTAEAGYWRSPGRVRKTTLDANGGVEMTDLIEIGSAASVRRDQPVRRRAHPSARCRWARADDGAPIRHWWTGHAPILFPIVGRLSGDTLRIDGTELSAEASRLRPARALCGHRAGRPTAPSSASPRAEETRAAYPFAFALDLRLPIHGATLDIDARKSPIAGDTPMPTSFGWHPAFALAAAIRRIAREPRITSTQTNPER